MDYRVPPSSPREKLKKKEGVKGGRKRGKWGKRKKKKWEKRGGGWGGGRETSRLNMAEKRPYLTKHKNQQGLTWPVGS